jgi:hypothetical protein
VPACQFRVPFDPHPRPPDAVFALSSVTAREIRFFRFLTWLRSPRVGSPGGHPRAAGRPTTARRGLAVGVPPAEDPPRELVSERSSAAGWPGRLALRPGISSSSTGRAYARPR